ncbi:MAG: hypothetical protein JSS27_10840 [Planctomycetes bacterium]|nr:hypothetical protein [Planctomycetota bacterium]
MGLLVTSAVAWALVAARPALAADDAANPLAELVGKTVQIVLKAGKTIDDAEVTKVVAAPNKPSAIKAITVKVPPSGKVQTVAAAMIDEMNIGDEPADVTFDRKLAAIVHSPEKRSKRLEHEAAVKSRLEGKRAQFWPELSTDEQAKLVSELKSETEASFKKHNAPPMTLYETKYYLFYTNMPQEQIAEYITKLDLMYTELCKVFSIPPGKNIWHGKCVVVCFIEQAAFQAYERLEFNKTDTDTYYGLCHSYSDGKTIVTCFRGSDPAAFGNLLVHETSHGFLHRYRTSIHIISWVNEGVADWVAGAAVKGTILARKQQAGADRARQQGNLGGNFFDQGINIEGWQYGVAASMVDILLKIDGRKYKQFIDGIKEGLDWPDALQAAYGMSPEELVQRYGYSIGVPQLRP